MKKKFRIFQKEYGQLFLIDSTDDFEEALLLASSMCDNVHWEESIIIMNEKDEIVI